VIRRRGRCLAGAALTGLLALGGATITREAPAAEAGGSEARYRELRRVADRNTGRAHLTRGVNMYTLIALRSCVDEADVPVLGRLLEDRDPVIRRAAALVLADLGLPGRQALLDARVRATDPAGRELLEEALQEAAPGRPALRDYPLTEAERRRLRGCPPTR
jgi:hypothetical protein